MLMIIWRGGTIEKDTKFHWDEGMKYALEAIKTLFILNRAAVASILTFIGNRKNGSDILVYSMGCFALGAAIAPISFVLAYLAQLNYGNSSEGGVTSEIEWTDATRWNYSVYGLFIPGIVFFVVGIFLAGVSLMEMRPALATLAID